jgi:hypothetical protein
MIQIKAKNKYWQSGKRWQRLWTIPSDFDRLDFENYQHILGDKIFTEPTEEARAAFDAVMMWRQLQSPKL